MEASEVASLVERYQKEKDHIHNEEETKTKLIVPFLRLLGYNPESGNQVRLEYRGDFQTKATKPAKDSEPMDYAIFDRDDRPIMVIEAKKLGGDVQARSAQLGVYVNKMAGLHLGIITDGCEYLFYADLDAPNVMDDKPFYRFSLAETATDWGQVASFLTKLSCKNFSNETLTIDAENCRYRQAMVEKLIAVMRAPNSDHDFMSEWLCKGLL
ncbi:MAG: type I restriction enzyme HsdR N-terminal domain-containing protein, partial [Candidatus Eisenbacteria bacterium]|nr:type I restriction enzyme HsdR N-terminal domain-containing protein [Candidatus Eisenbacteria bacterium]